MSRQTLQEFCTAQKRPELLVEWDLERNAPLTPDDVTFASHKKSGGAAGTGIAGRLRSIPARAAPDALIVPGDPRALAEAASFPNVFRRSRTNGTARKMLL